jgi:hypothetical protein
MKPEVFEFGGYGVNVKLTVMETSKDIVWVRGNSFVLVDSPEQGSFLLDGQRVELVSINGIGEIRWKVWERDIIDGLRYEKEGKTNINWDCIMHLAAYKHFGLDIYVRHEV